MRSKRLVHSGLLLCVAFVFAVLARDIQAQQSKDCGIGQAQFNQCAFTAILKPEDNTMERDPEAACSGITDPVKHACCLCDNWVRIRGCYTRFCNNSADVPNAEAMLTSTCSVCKSGEGVPSTDSKGGPSQSPRDVSDVADKVKKPIENVMQNNKDNKDSKDGMMNNKDGMNNSAKDKDDMMNNKDGKNSRLPQKNNKDGKKEESGKKTGENDEDSKSAASSQYSLVSATRLVLGATAVAVVGAALV